MRRRLSDDEAASLGAMWADPALTIAEMARRLGRDANVVQKAGVARWGPREPIRPQNRPWRPWEVAEAVVLVKEDGLPARTAAQLLGRGRQYLARAVRGLVRPRDPDERARKAVRLLRAGKTNEEAARAVRAGPELVRFWRRKAGLPPADGRARMAAAMRGTGRARMAVREMNRAVSNLAAGWPLCSNAEREVLEALEAGPTTAAGVAARAGLAAGSVGGARKTLNRCVARAWVFRERSGPALRYGREEKLTYVYRLADAVLDRRRRVRAVKC